MTRKAVIDMGTNTFNLLIAELIDKDWRFILKREVPVFIGKGSMQKKMIQEDAMQRAWNCLDQFKNDITIHSVDNCFVFATSAIRNANNAQFFCDALFQRYQWEISVISGTEEAEAIYFGAKSSIPFTDQTFLVMDIGGGSVEFIIGNSNEIFWKKSFECGGSRLLEKFPLSNPAIDAELNVIRNYLKNELSELSNIINNHHPAFWIGTAGAFDTLKSVIEAKGSIALPKFGMASYLCKYDQLNIFISSILSSTYEERITIKGLPEFRIEMILYGALLMEFTSQLMKDKDLVVSEYALKEGMSFFRE